ncbi:MAG: single-stranded DNA-binding protein [Christensenellales bacterium]
MNKAIFIGNLTRDPQLRSVNTPSGAASVCDLSIAINERRGTQTKTTYAQVTVWRAQLEMQAEEVKFLSGKSESGGDVPEGMTQVEPDDSPF